MNNGKRLVVIGAGPMGLTAAYHAAKQGYFVEVLEAGDRPGGMAAHFDFDGLSIERFYHFCCRTDHDTFALLEELGLTEKLRWVSTRMAFFVDGKMYRWGDPLALLAFPKLDPISKIRYGLHIYLSSKRNDWTALDRISAEKWFIAWTGRRAYDRLWKPLLQLKFSELSGKISAAWMWDRIRRQAKSRKNLFEEQLGYIEGGSETLINALVTAIKAKGGKIHLNTAASRITMEDGAVTGVEAGTRQFHAKQVISTIATPYLAPLLTDTPEDMRNCYTRIGNIGAICVIHKLKRSISANFWVNISDPRMDIPGIIEFSNLRPMSETIVYVPYYRAESDPKFSMSNESLVEESWSYLKMLNPSLNEADRLGSHVARIRYAQPVYEVGFSALIPPVETPVTGLQIADTCFYYPQDRGISESAALAKRMVEALDSQMKRPNFDRSHAKVRDTNLAEI